MPNDIAFPSDTKKKKKGKGITLSPAIWFILTFIVGLTLLGIGFRAGTEQGSRYYYDLKNRCDGRVVLVEAGSQLGYKCSVR